MFIRVVIAFSFRVQRSQPRARQQAREESEEPRRQKPWRRVSGRRSRRGTGRKCARTSVTRTSASFRRAAPPRYRSLSPSVEVCCLHACGWGIGWGGGGGGTLALYPDHHDEAAPLQADGSCLRRMQKQRLWPQVTTDYASCSSQGCRSWVGVGGSPR